jgi:hypothetical protein
MIGMMGGFTPVFLVFGGMGMVVLSLHGQQKYHAGQKHEVDSKKTAHNTDSFF